MKALPWIALLALYILQAQAAKEPANTLLWDDLRKLASQQNPDLQSAIQTRRSYESAVKAAWGEFLPNLKLGAEGRRTVTETSSVESRTSALTYSGTASLNLFSGFATVASLNRAKAASGESEASLALTSASLRHDLRVAYFNVYLNQQKILLNERDLQRVTRNQKLIELKYGSGTEARWNLKKTQAELVRAQFNLDSSKTQLETSRETLANLLNVDGLPQYPVEAPKTAELPSYKNSNLEAVRFHPEAVKNRFSAEKSAQDVKISRATYFPSLDLSFTRSSEKSKTDPSPQKTTTSNAVGITASWNIFNGASDYFKVQQSSLLHEAAEFTLSGTERRLLSTLRNKDAAYRIALAQQPVAKALREAAEEREQTVSGQYRAGLKTYLDWEQAESELLSTEQGEISALSALLTAYADLELALGYTLEQP